MKLKFTIRTIAIVSSGYFVVGIFALSFIVASHAEDWLRLPAPLSEATILIIAAVITAPLVVPFIWQRITKIKFGELAIDLAQVSERVEEKLAVDLVGIEIHNLGLGKVSDLKEASLLDYTPGREIAAGIKAAQTAKIIEVDLGEGDRWWSSRLFLLAALSDDFTGIRQIIILEKHRGQERVFGGSSTPAMLRQGLANNAPELEEVYESAKRESTLTPDMITLEGKAALVVLNFIKKLEAHREEEGVMNWVTTDLLDRCLAINRYRIEWNGDSLSTLLLHQIIDRIEPYVPLVSNNGHLNQVIDRLELVERIAKSFLRQRLEGAVDRG